MEYHGPQLATRFSAMTTTENKTGTGEVSGAAATCAEPKRLSLRRNMCWTLAGTVVYSGSQWGILMALAKLGTPETVGVFGLALAVCAPIVMFANLQLRTVQATDVSCEYEFRDYLLLRIFTTFFALILISLIVFAGPFSSKTAIVIFLVGLAKGLESISDIIYGLLQQRERMDRIAQLQVFKGIVSLFSMVYIFYLTGSLAWAVVAMTGVWAACLFAFDVPSAAWVLAGKERKPHTNEWNLTRIGRLARSTFSLGLATFLTSLNRSIPRYFIETFLGTYKLGIFVAISAFMKAGNDVFLTLGHSASARLGRYYQAGNQAAFRRLIWKILAIGTLLGTVGVLAALLCGRQILSVVFTPEYANYSRLFFWIMVATAVSYLASLEHAIIAAKKHAQLVGIWAVTVLSALFASIVLIPWFGLEGAAVAILAAQTARLLATHAAIWRKSSVTQRCKSSK